jgi:uncharacterized membrane protein
MKVNTVKWLAFILWLFGWILSEFFALSGNQMLALKFDLVGYMGLAASLVIMAISSKE